MQSRLDWAERAALERLHALREANQSVAGDAARTLTLLLVAIAAAFAYAISGPQFAIGAIVLTAYLCVLSVLLIFSCLMAGDVPTSVQTSGRPLDESIPFDDFRRLELISTERRIEALALRHNRALLWLNTVRIAASVAPFVFVGVVLYVGRAALSA
jgi:hypothetical protein